MKQATALALLCALLAGCQDRFRYACQDPKNWEAPECVRPACAVTGVCPDQLNKLSDMKLETER